MSDGSYIVSEANVRDLFDKDGNFLGTNQDHWMDQALDDVGWDEGGRIGSSDTAQILNKNKFDAIRDRRRMFYSASGKELYLESVKRLMQKISINKMEFTIMMSVAMNRGHRIEYASPIGMFYGVKYLLTHHNYTGDSLKKELKNLVEEAEKEGVSSFDIIRYFRFISMYNTIQAVGKNTFDKNVKIKLEKIPYKKMVNKKEEVEE
jgi:hypothetical protein